MVQMALCDLLHTYHKQVTNVSPACFCHPTVGNFDVSPYFSLKKGFTYLVDPNTHTEEEFVNNVPHKCVIYLGTEYYLVGLGVEGGELGLVVQHLLKVGHVPLTVGRVTMETLGRSQKISIKPKIKFYV